MKSNLFFHCIVAIATTGLMAILGLQLSSINVEAPYLMFLPGIIAAVTIGGGIAGAVAVVLAGILTWFFFIPPVWSFGIPSSTYGITFLLYLAVTVLVCRLYDKQRRMIDELANANIDLRAKLAKLGRTDALV